MQFLVKDRGRGWAAPTSYPALYLVNDLWDDYGFKTTYHAYLVAEPTGDRINLGTVKIARRGQTTGRTTLPGDRFERLPEGYFSLGQEFSYYEALQSHGPELRDQVLEALRDVARFPEIETSLGDEEVYQTSLLRFSGAVRAIEDARSLFANASTARSMEFGFRTAVGGDEFEIRLAFGDDPIVPSRIVAIIGYNGAGKTQLLANLAMIAQADDRQRRHPELQRAYGRFVDGEPHFAAVVTVSYSAFDTFPLPEREGNGASSERSEFLGHVYCGLRKRRVKSSTTPAWALKTIGDITDDFARALAIASGRDRREVFEAVVEALALEPSFAVVEVSEFLALDGSEATRRFQLLSTGHKIVLNIVTQLVAHLQPNSLVLIDEPECHLHPPLLAALLKSVGAALNRFSSFAIVATHSPVVLQEIPRRYVRVLQRFATQTVVTEPPIETFGENIGTLTRQVFSLDASGTDYEAVLRQLRERFTNAEIEQLFGGSLSAQARAYLASADFSD